MTTPSKAHSYHYWYEVAAHDLVRATSTLEVKNSVVVRTIDPELITIRRCNVVVISWYTSVLSWMNGRLCCCCCGQREEKERNIPKIYQGISISSNHH